METSKSLQRILIELKTLDKRINDKIAKFKPVGVSRTDHMVATDVKDITTFESNAKADYQAITDLIQRRFDLKCVLLQMNAATTVTINGKKYTIAEAIEYKNIIILKRNLLKRMISENNNAIDRYDDENARNERSIENLLTTSFGKDTSKVDVDAIRNITDTYNKTNKVTRIDPLNIQREIEDLNKEIDLFTEEVDAALSEINAVTMATI